MIIVFLLLLALTFLGVCWKAASILVAPANCHVGPPPDSHGLECVQFPSASGGMISAWCRMTADSRAVVVMAHGLRGDRRRLLARAELCLKQGFDVLLIDLQAHGESLGEKITVGYRERHDIEAAVGYARQRASGKRIGIIGVSLGGAATVLASPLSVDAVVLESVYPTIYEAVSNRMNVRFGPLGRLLTFALICQIRPRLGFPASALRPIDHIRFVGCPVLILSGDQDRHTTSAESQRLFEAAGEPKEFVIFPGAGHCDLLAHRSDLYENSVVRFLRRYLL